MVISPYISSLNQDKIATDFNYFLRSYKVHIEQALGMLVSKWRILRKKLSYSVRKSIKVIFSFTKLHNFDMNNDMTGERH